MKYQVLNIRRVKRVFEFFFFCRPPVPPVKKAPFLKKRLIGQVDREDGRGP